MQTAPFKIEELGKNVDSHMAFLQLVTRVLEAHRDFKKIAEELNANIASIKRGEQGLPGLPGFGTPGKDADEEKIVESVLSKLPNEDKIYARLYRQFAKLIPKVKDGEHGRDGLDMTPEMILETIKKSKLKPEDIEGFEQTVSAYLDQMRHRMGYVHGGGDTIEAGTGITATRTTGGKLRLTASSSTNFSEEETPTGTINGSNTAFTLANTPLAGSLKLYLNGSRQKAAGEDYTLAGSTITFVVAPQTGSKLLADYRY